MRCTDDFDTPVNDDNRRTDVGRSVSILEITSSVLASPLAVTGRPWPFWFAFNEPVLQSLSFHLAIVLSSGAGDPYAL